ncbi:MAG: hypothetical protein PHQ14_09895 [Chromatiales bacterium]|jgi:hypothetical protein|nr:hypothetical protein [Chromatiales bacterium]MDX9767785.1 hypothetical protein [Ectothiorhodospiraceae bacterium]
MRMLKYLVVGALFGLVIGLWFGVNIGRDKPFYANPFKEKALDERVRDSARDVYEDTRRKLDKAMR